VPEIERVLEANGEFYAAFTSRSFAAMDALWAAEAEVSCLHPGWMPLTGRADVLRSWAAILTNPGQARVVPGAAQARIVGEVAIVTCREFVAGTPLVATNLFVDEGGRWRMVHHHSSPVAIAEE
jgi:ketosteroid isomerase-like protein